MVRLFLVISKELVDNISKLKNDGWREILGIFPADSPDVREKKCFELGYQTAIYRLRQKAEYIDLEENTDLEDLKEAVLYAAEKKK